MNFYYADASNQPVGPVPEEHLHAIYRSGTITLDTLVIAEGASEWQEYRSISQSIKSLVPVLQVARPPQFISAPPAQTRETQKCPFCAEDIAAAAKKCKHCGETLDVALRAAEESKRAHANQPMVFMNAGGGASVAASEKHKFPNGFHLFLTIVTGGAWSIVWLLLYVFRDKNYYR